MQDNIPPAEHISKVEKRIMSTPPVLVGTMDKGWSGRMGSEGVCFGLIR